MLPGCKTKAADSETTEAAIRSGCALRGWRRRRLAGLPERSPGGRPCDDRPGRSCPGRCGRHATRLEIVANPTSSLQAKHPTFEPLHDSLAKQAAFNRSERGIIQNVRVPHQIGILAPQSTFTRLAILRFQAAYAGAHARRETKGMSAARDCEK